MKMAPREIALGIATVTIGLYALTFGWWLEPRLAEWKRLGGESRDLGGIIAKMEQLISEKDTWAAQLAEVGGQLQSFPADRQMDVYWLSEMDRLAAQNGVQIIKRQAGDIQQEGTVFELPIDCKEWTGNLEALVRFLFDLQSQGAMLDVRFLHIKPHKDGMLRGQFELYCAYTQERAADNTAPAVEPPSTEPVPASP